MKIGIYLTLAFGLVFWGCSKGDSAATGPDMTLRAPTDLKVTQVGVTAVRLTWTDNNESEEGFAIERQRGQGSFVQQLFTAPNVTTAIDSVGLTASSTYNYRVRAMRYSDRGDYSSVASIQLALPYP
jgi:hypothetical protein